MARAHQQAPRLPREAHRRGAARTRWPSTALAMEYRSLGRHDEALQTFTTLRADHPDYVPMYLMCGQMLEKLDRKDDARGWYEAGIAKARARGDGHAASELESALAACPSRRLRNRAEVRSSAYVPSRRAPARIASSRALMRASSPRSVGS